MKKLKKLSVIILVLLLVVYLFFPRKVSSDDITILHKKYYSESGELIVMIDMDNYYSSFNYKIRDNKIYVYGSIIPIYFLQLQSRLPGQINIECKENEKIYLNDTLIYPWLNSILYY